MPSTSPVRRPLAWGVAATVALLLASFAPAIAPAGAAGPPTTQTPQSYLVADGDTGAIVAASNEHVAHLTASTIKILTALVTLERLPMSARLQVSHLAASQPAMRIDMKEGSQWPLDQALVSLLMVSANDAAYAMAENAGGSLDRFAVLANATAKRYGMQDTAFADPAGLDGAQGFGGGSMSSAYDLAVAARNALAVPAVADDAAKVTYEFTDPSGAGRRLTNHNKGFLTGYPGAIGLKTGFTKAASRTLLAAARRDGHTCIASVMGTWDDTGWASYLLDECFAGVRVAGAAPLPPVRVHLAPARTQAPRVVSSTPAPSAPAAAPSGGAGAAVAANAPVGHTTHLDAVRTAATTKAPAGGGDTTLASALKTVGLVLLGLLVVLVLLRRRAVRRQKARRIERMRALEEARRRRMIDIVEPDDTESDVRVVPGRTSHHVAGGRRRQSDRRVVRPPRPRGHTPSGDRADR
ncbi:MAG: D-alanyl-D-alanine carboxypeptidase family protein [Acidimicrobiia bacterium]